MKKKIVYIDMDGVIADFIGSYRKWHHPETNKFPQSNWGFFANLDPIEGAIDAVKELMDHFDVYILTRPSYQNILCYTEKRVWIEKYFGLEFCQKIIMSCNKSLLKGDYLIDDTLEHGQTEFEGELLHFGVGHRFENWDSIKFYLYMKNHIFRGDDGSVGEELLMNVPDIELKCNAVYDSVKEGYFKLGFALKTYGVTKADYVKFLNSKGL